MCFIFYPSGIPAASISVTQVYVYVFLAGLLTSHTHGGAVNKVMTETDRTHALVRSTSLQPSKKDGSRQMSMHLTAAG